jgi:DNA-binding beta-propeller fold protein YncE
MRRCGASTVVVLAAVGLVDVAVGAGPAQRGRSTGPRAAAPQFQVDPMWPKPMPNGWILGSVTGVAVDSRDHIWVVHRGAASLTARTENGLGTDPPTAELCCRPAPPVLEFDAAGTLISSWGGPGQGFDWPQSPGGISVDAKGSVWIAAAGADAPAGRGGRGARGGGGGGAAGAAAGPPPPPPASDAHVLKFSRTGQFQLALGAFGKPGGADSTTGLNRPTSVEVDPTGAEVFVTDGAANRRVVVFDAATGAYKRHWGAYGAPPDPAAPLAPYDPSAPAAKQFRGPTCASVSRDGHVYVCDRQNNRIQVFTRDGKFVKEAVVSKATLGNGAVWDIAFSHDAQQQFLYVADGQNQRITVVHRDSLESIGHFGAGGRYPGQFYAVGSIAVDSRGNVYTGETLEGKRVQKFNLRPVTATPRGGSQ